MSREGSPQPESELTKDHQSPYEKTLAEIEKVLDASPEAQRKFVTDRLALLTKDAAKGEIMHVGQALHSGFIGPEMVVRRSNWVDPISIDDPDLYTALLKTMKEFRTSPNYRDKPLREFTGSAIQWTVIRYFGNPTGTPNTDARNRKLYSSLSSDKGVISIQEFKGKNSAVCAEKAPAAQNLLAFVGLESDLIASTNCRIPAEKDEEGHYFILLHRAKGPALYDPTNPRIMSNKDGDTTGYFPAMYDIADDQAKQLLAGESVSVVHEDNQMDASGTWHAETSNRIYAGPMQLRK